jgi:hypothetical protein
MLDVIAGDAKGLDTRCDIAVADFGGAHDLGSFSRALLDDIPAFRAFDELWRRLGDEVDQAAW